MAQNIEAETQIIKDEISADQAKKKVNPSKQMKEYQDLEKLSKGVLADISTVSELQTTIMSTGTDGEVITKDQDMADASAKIEKALKDTGSFVKEFKDTEEKKQKEMLAQKEVGDDGPIHTKERTQAEKDEMAAFLAG